MAAVNRDLEEHKMSDKDDNEDEMYTEIVYLDDQFEDIIEEENDDKEELIDEKHQEEDEEEVFYCSSCDVNIKSVEQHIQECHFGENIVVEVQDTPKPVEFVKLEPIDIYDDEHESDLNSIPDTHRDSSGKSSSSNANVMVIKPTSSGQVYKCKQCEASFASVKSLSAHMRVHKSNNLKNEKDANTKSIVKEEPILIEKKVQWICSFCNTEFLSLKSLKLHGRMHNPIKQKTFEETAEQEAKYIKQEQTEMFYCDLCDKSYSVTLKEMHSKMHSNYETFMCMQCNRKFTDAEHLELHLRAHNEARVIQTKAEMRNIRLPYACQYCNKEFARPHEKVKHERIHTGEKPYSCEVCGKTFRVAYCLTLHMRTHTDARPFVCAQCNKRFKSNSVYNHHLLTHSNVRAYQCPYCPKAFKTSVQLSGHKNSHTKPFSCTECNRPFATLYAVKIHMQTHQKTNHNLKHACDICGATYARGFALKDHIKEQHADNEYCTDLNQVATSNGIILADMDEETEIAGQSILPDNINDRIAEEITIGEINQFENEEVVTDWFNK